MFDNSETHWHQLSVDQTFEKLETDEDGLTSGEAKTRLQNYGYNELLIKKPSALMRFLRQFHNPLVYILLAAEGIELTKAQTAALMTIVMVHVGYVFTARSTFKSAFTFSPLPNRWLLNLKITNY